MHELMPSKYRAVIKLANHPHESTKTGQKHLSGKSEKPPISIT